MLFFFFKQKTAYEMRISDWSSDVCSSDLRRFGAQETFLVRVQNSHKAAFGNVQTFPQQVDADKHIIHSQTQIADKLDTLQRFDIGVHVADLDARLMHELCEIFRHAFGKRGDKGAIRSEEHTSELQSLMRISYAVFCLKKKKR